jgi:hypothetical protein
MKELRVVFTGLCAQTSFNDRHVVVCPSGLRRYPASVSGGDPIPLHLPLITTTADTANREPDDSWGKDTDGDRKDDIVFKLWIPLRERVEVVLFAGATVKQPQSVDYVDNGVTGRTPANGNDTDIHWIANMEDIWPERARIRKECLPNGPTPIDRSVALQVVVPGGTLSTRPASVYSVSRFAPVKKKAVEQYIAREMVITLALEDDVTAVHLRSTSLEAGTRNDDLILPVGTDSLEIMFGNADFADVLLIAHQQKMQSKKSPDSHFELYYDILEPVSASTAASNQLPIPGLVPTPAMRGARSNCPVLLTEDIP